MYFLSSFYLIRFNCQLNIQINHDKILKTSKNLKKKSFCVYINNASVKILFNYLFCLIITYSFHMYLKYMNIYFLVKKIYVLVYMK